MCSCGDNNYIEGGDTKFIIYPNIRCNSKEISKNMYTFDVCKDKCLQDNKCTGFTYNKDDVCSLYEKCDNIVENNQSNLYMKE